MQTRRSLFLLSISLSAAVCNSSSSVSTPSSLPRSRTAFRSNSRQLWTPSEHVNRQGFLLQTFQRESGPHDPRCDRRSLKKRPTCLVRQVPGDGNCLFHSISLCLRHAVNQTHWNMENDVRNLYQHSRSLRKLAVDCLEDVDEQLYLQGREWVTKRDLLESTAQQYGLSSKEYCATMREDAVWGGGPEIVALCNVLRRPIHVYELCGERQFSLQRMACFGSPAFDDAEALHILSADSRFPDLEPGSQMSSGNHFMSLFPMPRQQLRGGDYCWGQDRDDAEVYRILEEKTSTHGAPLFQRVLRRCSHWWGTLTGGPV